MRQTRRPLVVIVSILAALTLLVGAFALAPADADTAMSPLELAQVQRANCQDLAAHATSSAQRSRANQCIADQGVIIAALTSGGTPSPSISASPSSTPTASASASPSSSSSTPPPSVSTSPSSTASSPPTGPLVNCQSNPGRCGFPDALSTGPSGALSLSTRTSYATAGETIVNTQINGCAVVRAANVTFRNVLFNAAGCFWGVQSLSSGLSIVDSEITCGGANGTGVGSSGFSLLRVDIHNCENGLDVGGSISIVDSWIHDGVTANGAHTDGIQIGQGAAGITVRHNTIVMPTPGSTAAIIGWDEGDPQMQQVVIDGNLLSGGTYTLYCARQGTSDTRVTNNRFGPYEFGSSNACTGSHVSAWSGNVVDATGAPLAAA